jgi:hypothetical protein
MADIRRSEVVVADFTQHKAGVYFEAGFAMGLGQSVVFTCRREDYEDAHFDTRPHNHILWLDEKLGEFLEALAARLQNTVHSSLKALDK